MPKKYFKKSLIIFILIIFSVGFFANAQVRNTDIILNISPEYPGLNQNVNATLNSYVIDLNKTNITWSINNQEESIGIGKKSFSFKTGEIGSSIIVSATINTIDGQNISKTITIVPANIDILWEAYDVYTPPFYKGKTLVPSQGKFKIVAIPNIVNQNGKVNSNNLSYLWKKDDKTQLDSSGWGKNYFIFQNSYLDKINTIEVTTSDILGGINATGKIILNTIKPKIIFYESDSSLGTKWQDSINDGFSINKSGSTIIAEPYFFSPKNINSSELSFVWSINGDKIPAQLTKNVLPIVPENGKSGTALISLLINNINTLFQSKEQKLNVQF